MRGLGWLLSALLLVLPGMAQQHRNKVIVDTDVGDDVDDAFAIDLVLASPELEVLGLSSAWGDTALRARMLDRMVCETGRKEIAVHAGVKTDTDTKFTQAAWARAGVAHEHGDAVGFLLEQARAAPGEVTVLALGPLTNLAAAYDRDPEGFRKLKQVVLMGGSIRRGYGDVGKPAEPEYNIARDPQAAQKLLRSGVKVSMLPLDSTQLKFGAERMKQLAAISTPMTDALQVLVAEWGRGLESPVPTLFDAVAAAYLVDPATCPMTPLHVEVDGKGMTLEMGGAANAQACLEAQPEAFFGLLMPRLVGQRMVGTGACLARQ
jgi:purine nucleosidase